MTKENCEPIEHPYNNIKCAGMPQRCKDLFEVSLKGNADINGYTDNVTRETKEWSEDEKEFLFKDGNPIKRTFNDFKVGLKIPGKLRPKRIRGGILLVSTTYEMR